MRQTVLAGVSTQLLYDGVDLVAEYDAAGKLLRRYVHGPGTDEPLVAYEGAALTVKSDRKISQRSVVKAQDCQLIMLALNSCC